MELLERKSEFNADINYSNIKAHQSVNEAKEMSKKMNISDSIFFHYKLEQLDLFGLTIFIYKLKFIFVIYGNNQNK